MLQTRVLQKKQYQIRNIDTTDYSQRAFERKEKLDKIALLLSEGCSEETTLQALDVKRSVYYRWKKNYNLYGLSGLENESRRPKNIRKQKWTSVMEQRVYQLRRKFPLWGKAKITVMYKQEFNEIISESTVGRILKKLLKTGKIKSVRFLYGKNELKPRVFNGHSQRWKFGMKAQKPGELIQVDHMTVHVPGIGHIKHFNATCPVTKYVVYQAYEQATSKTAADFFQLMQSRFPFPILSIQVDGGSEFRAEFETATQARKIPLFVLPPRSPKFNGGVERSNGNVKYEFYYQYDRRPTLTSLRHRLHEFADFYNAIRPHHGLGLLTPLRFYELINKTAPQSHML